MHGFEPARPLGSYTLSITESSPTAFQIRCWNPLEAQSRDGTRSSALRCSRSSPVTNATKSSSSVLSATGPLTASMHHRTQAARGWVGSPGNPWSDLPMDSAWDQEEDAGEVVEEDAMSHRTLTILTATAAAVLALLGGGAPAAADHAERVIVLPGATSAEGIAKGAGSTFYAGDLFSGDIYRGDIRKGTAAKFIDNAPGRNAVGLRVDLDDGLLFVAGGFTGQGYVYDLDTGATVASYQFSTDTSVINDVAVTADGAWFTNSFAAELYFVPVVDGVPGPFTTLALSGPAADTSGEFNNNGIQATADGSTLVVAHSAQGALNLVDPDTGASSTVAGLSLPSIDGFVLQGRTVYAVQNGLEQIAQVRLSGDLTSGTVTKVIMSELFAVPTTVDRFGDELAAVNAHFDTGFPPTSPTYEVVVVDR